MKTVVCCLDQLKENHPGEYEEAGIHSLILKNFHDGKHGSIEPFATQGADFIHSQISQSERIPILVHCSVGKSRATSVTVVYLMKYKNMSLRDAMQLVRSSRPRAYPLLQVTSRHHLIT